MLEDTKQALSKLKTDRLEIVAQSHNLVELSKVFADKNTMELYPMLLLGDDQPLEQSLKLLAKYNILVFPFIENGSGVVVGFITLNNIEEDAKEIEIGYFLGSTYWGRGYAGEIVQGLVALLTKQGWRKINASLYSGNTASEKLLQKCGFTLERIDKDKHTINGKAHDDIVYSMQVK